MTDDLLTTTDVARLAGILPATVRTHRRRDGIPAPSGYVGRTPFWHRAVVDEWLRSRRARGQHRRHANVQAPTTVVRQPTPMLEGHIVVEGTSTVPSASCDDCAGPLDCACDQCWRCHGFGLRPGATVAGDELISTSPYSNLGQN